MKEIYESPALELLRLAAEEYLAKSEIEFGDMLDGGGNGVSADPNIDIDIPLI